MREEWEGMISEKINISLDHPIMKGHKVFGEAVLPGLAYIDLIYQVFRNTVMYTMSSN